MRRDISKRLADLERAAAAYREVGKVKPWIVVYTEDGGQTYGLDSLYQANCPNDADGHVTDPVDIAALRETNRLIVVEYASDWRAPA